MRYTESETESHKEKEKLGESMCNISQIKG